MIAFVVSLNGQRIGTVGVGDSGVLSAKVDWIGLHDDSGKLYLSMFGLDDRNDEHVDWAEPPPLKIGDTVTIQVVEADVVDEPIERQTVLEFEKERIRRRATDELPD